MPLIAARVDATSAWRILANRWPWSRPQEPRIARAGSEQGTLPCIEIIGLPVHELHYSVGRQDGPANAACLVDALTGIASIREPDSLRFADRVDVEQFAPVLGAADAAKIARTTLLRTVVYPRQTGLTIGEPALARVVHWPYWVYYYRRAKRIDIRALDAVTGSKIGQKLKLGILEAFRRGASRKRDGHGETGDQGWESSPREVE